MEKLSLLGVARENMRRRRFRSLVLILTVGVATATPFTITMLLWGMETGIRRGMASLGADLVVVPLAGRMEAFTILTGESRTLLMEGLASDKFIERDVIPFIAKLEGVVAVTPQTYLSTRDEVQIIGFDPQTDFILKPLLENKIKWPIAKNELVVGNDLLPPPGPGKGVNSRKIYGSDFTIVGRLRKTGTGIDDALFIPLEGVHSVVENAAELAGPAQAPALKILKPGLVSSILIKVDLMAMTLKEAVVKVREVVPPTTMVFKTMQTVTELNRQFLSILQGLFMFGLAVWGMSVLVVGAIFSMTINERRREMGLLRAMGASARSIFRLVIYESSMLTGLGGIIGVGLGAGFVYYFDSVIKTTLKIPYAWPPANYILALVLICVAAAAVAGVVGALYPAIRSSKMEPFSAIRQGE